MGLGPGQGHGCALHHRPDYPPGGPGSPRSPERGWAGVSNPGGSSASLPGRWRGPTVPLGGYELPTGFPTFEEGEDTGGDHSVGDVEVVRVCVFAL